MPISEANPRTAFDDAPEEAGDWGAYLAKLRETGRFQGGSAIGGGACVRKDGAAEGALSGLTGYLRVEAASLEDVTALLAGNPHFEAGGTVEIRELPRTD